MGNRSMAVFALKGDRDIREQFAYDGAGMVDIRHYRPDDREQNYRPVQAPLNAEHCQKYQS